MDSLRSILEDMPYQGYGGTLSELIKLTNIKPSSKRKADDVEVLYRFYTNTEAAAGLFKQLNAYEKALLTCVVQSKYRPLYEDISEIAKAYNYKENKESFYGRGYRERFFPNDSKLNAFFCQKRYPSVL